MKAKQIEWKEQYDKLGFYRSSEMGTVICILTRRRNGRWQARIEIAGKIPYSHRASLTLDEAKQWCQDQLDQFIQQIAEEEI